MTAFDTILWLGRDFEEYSSAFYQYDVQEVFAQEYPTFQYGPGFKNYDQSDNIYDIIKKVGQNPDLVVISNTLLKDSKDAETALHHPELDLENIDATTLFFLNKEYTNLDVKLDYIRRNDIDYVTTVLRDHCQEWEKKTGATFIWKPFGIDLDRFQYNHNILSKYDFGFSGSLHEEYLEEREQIKEHLFKNRYFDFSWWHNFVHTRRFKDRYDNLTIYWGERDQNAINPFHNRAPHRETRYVKLLNKCDMFLNTRSAMGIMNPRFWELMATKTLIVCPDDEYYGLLEDGENCVMYNNLNEFDELIQYYADDDEERNTIVDQAYETVDQFKWTKVIEELLNEIS